jgi:hypothetical protein
MTTTVILADYLVLAGPHPLCEDARWWMIAFDFGGVQVSIEEAPFTVGVEMMVWGMSERPLTNVTPAQAVQVLEKLVERMMNDEQ